MRILLIDGSNYVHRGWHACPPMKNKAGFPTHGIKGTLSIVLADIRHVKPDRTIVFFDIRGKKKTWRSEVYPEYKKSESRVKSKEDNIEVFTQFKPVRKILKAMGIRQVAKAGVEADDMIGTIATYFADAGHEVIISSKDKDFASLVNRRIKMLKSSTRKILGPKEIEESFGVRPDQMVEYLMLLGDKVDNIPGITKCGPGTASKWLQKYGDIKTLRKNVDDLTPAIKAHFKRDHKNFKWTRQLLEIRCDMPHKTTLENCAYGEPNMERLKQLCDRYELRQTFKEIKVMLREVRGKTEEKNRWAK